MRSPLSTIYNLEKAPNHGIQPIKFFDYFTQALKEHYLKSTVSSMAMHHDHSPINTVKSVTDVTFIQHA